MSRSSSAPSLGSAGPTRRSSSRRTADGGAARRSSSRGGGRDPSPPNGTDHDPTDGLDPDPELPDRHRFCRNPKCRRPVGRTSTISRGQATGFCRSCGWGYDFRPPLQPDPATGHRVTVAGRYEVYGALGRGGLGWVYKARDHRLHIDVVLKGLLDPDGPGKRAVTRDELQQLADANHESIPAVHDFVQHAHLLPPRAGGLPGGQTTVEYIVMDYIHGRSLADTLKQHYARTKQRLTIPKAVSYLLPVMGALAYLHRRGLVYNDLKPANVMIDSWGRSWLVDLGAVSGAGGDPGYGTKGYRDPDGNPPSAQTDIYTIGRTLAALTIPVELEDEKKPLPGPDAVPLLAEHPSFDLLLRRATAKHPDQRFANIDELTDQLEAVLREVRSVDGGRQPGLSNVFAPEVRVVGTAAFPELPVDRAAWATALPDGLIDPEDPHATRIAALKAAGPRELLEALESLPDPTPETELQALRARVELSAVRIGTEPPRPAETAEYEDIVASLKRLADAEPDDVRVPWLRGIAGLVVGEVAEANRQFTDVLHRVPGEAAAKLARAVCAELAGRRADAARDYAMVWRTDTSYLSAAFGLARARLGSDVRTAVTVLGEVPSSSRYATDATLAALAAAAPRVPADGELARGYFTRAARLDSDEDDRLDMDDLRRQKAMAAVLLTAEGWKQKGSPWPVGDPPDALFGVPLKPRRLRDRLESVYRQLARNTALALGQRIAFVDEANRVRNWSLW